MLLQCPDCGASQYEPKLVISTNCRTCGVHLNVQRGKVRASKELAPALPRRADPPPLAPPPKRSLKPIGESSLGSVSPPVGSPPPVGESLPAALEQGFGAFLTGNLSRESAKRQAPTTKTNRSSSIAEPATRREQSSGGRVERSSKVRESPKPPDLWQQHHEAQQRHRPSTSHARVRSSPEANASQHMREPTTLQRMREGEVYRRAYFKDAVCFQCQHCSTVNRSARQTVCPKCGAAICLEDIEINLEVERPIQTRGDVLIRKRGALICSLLECGNLRCIGGVQGDILAAADACFGNDGRVNGKVRCKRLVIEKGATVEFTHPVQTDEAEIHAKLTGQIHCRGRLIIGKNGLVRGDVSAASVSIEPGGVLDGNIRIVTAYQPSATASH